MKKYLISAFALLLPLLGQAQGSVSYSMPQTVLVFKVDAQREQFFAGPYARYASAPSCMTGCPTPSLR